MLKQTPTPPGSDDFIRKVMLSLKARTFLDVFWKGAKPTTHTNSSPFRHALATNYCLLLTQIYSPFFVRKCLKRICGKSWSLVQFETTFSNPDGLTLIVVKRTDYEFKVSQGIFERNFIDMYIVRKSIDKKAPFQSLSPPPIRLHSFLHTIPALPCMNRLSAVTFSLKRVRHRPISEPAKLFARSSVRDLALFVPLRPPESP